MGPFVTLLSDNNLSPWVRDRIASAAKQAEPQRAPPVFIRHPDDGVSASEIQQFLELVATVKCESLSRLVITALAIGKGK